jgi:hypothetical protein
MDHDSGGCRSHDRLGVSCGCRHCAIVVVVHAMHVRSTLISMNRSDPTMIGSAVDIIALPNSNVSLR